MDFSELPIGDDMIEETSIEKMAIQVEVDEIVQRYLNALQTMMVIVRDNMVFWISGQVDDLRYEIEQFLT